MNITSVRRHHYQ